MMPRFAAAICVVMIPPVRCSKCGRTMKGVFQCRENKKRFPGTEKRLFQTGSI
jgi:hypothetical protein